MDKQTLTVQLQLLEDSLSGADSVDAPGVLISRNLAHHILSVLVQKDEELGDQDEDDQQ